MPKHTRNSSEPSYGGLPTGLAPSPIYIQQRMPMPPNYYAVPSSSSSSSMPIPQQQQQQQEHQPYEPYGTSAPSPTLLIPPSQHRASSGAWTPQDDHQLVAGRMQGLNWCQIRDTYFQSKTPNACRKRHERLMERKGADDWDAQKTQRMAKEYMGMRKEIWSGLAARTGEKWNVVEAKCMSNGLKNLQSAARAASRRDRLETGGSLTGYDDDSGISGIGLTPVDELDPSYSSPEASSSGTHSLSSSSAAGYPHQHQQHQQHHLQPHAAAHLQPHQASYGMGTAYYAGHGYSSSVSSTASMGHGYVSRAAPAGNSQGGNSPYLDGQRLSGADMGIDAIVNRPGGGRA